jgi:NAD(P)-dependent dehydrogenase (short-subunit alcohol dehydrogenase family)
LEIIVLVEVGGGVQLDGKVAIVTGAGSGIGRAIAMRFAAEGATVICADVSGAEAEVADQIGRAARPVHVDLRRAGDIAAMIEASSRDFGGLDVLCNNAGIGGPHHHSARSTRDCSTTSSP